MRGVYVADQDISIVSFFPHMHLRGKDMTMTATFPDGRRQVLLNVPNYDFNWQLFYYPREPITLPRGTRVDVVAHYDNSAANRANPDPRLTVRFGETSNDEMMFGTFEFVPVDGVSPVRPPRRSAAHRRRGEGSAADSSYLLAVPFVFRQMATAMTLPRSGDGVWYLTPRPGIIIDVPVTGITWTGNAFTFTTEVRIGGLGGRLNGSGVVGDEGRSTVSSRCPAADDSPLGKFSGTRVGN